MDFQVVVVTFVVLILLAIGASFFPNPKVQMYGKIALISLSAIFILIIIFFRKKPVSIDTKSQQFKDQVAEVKNNIKEVTTIATLKTQFAKVQEKEKLDKLDEVTKIKDKAVRRKQLAEMLG